MRKYLGLAIAVMTACAFATGCSTSNSSATAESETSAEESTAAETKAEETEVESEEDALTGDVQIANPWTESDKAGVLEATGFEMDAPDGAEDVVYSYMAESGLAQMAYILNGEEWNYRMQPADELTDISGCYYEWTSVDDGTVSGRPAKYYYCVSEDLNDTETKDVEVVNWYDVVPGVTYSLSVSGGDLNGLDIQVVAENIFKPLQGEATDDPEGDRVEELTNYFIGEFTSSYDGSTLSIAQNDDGTFAVNVDIFRLCSLEDGIGTFEDHKMSFTANDPNGNKLSGMIYRDNDNSLVVKITDSTWDYLPNGETFEGFVK